MSRLPEFVQKVVGPPGTGKTRRLLSYLEDEVKNGVSPSDVAFVTFGHDAIRMARRRALAAVNRISEGADDLPFFKTFHALAWKILGLRDLKRVTITPEHKRAFCDKYRLGYDEAYEQRVRGAADDDAVMDARLPFGNLVFTVDAWLTHNMLGVSEYKRAPLNFEGPTHDVPSFVDLWRRNKQHWGRLEFHDVLERCRAERPAFPPIAGFFDEFQDVNRLQYELYRQWSSQCERAYVAGDDDQTIFTWNGARCEFFIETHATGTEFMTTTHRFGEEVRKFGDLVIRRVARRQEKAYASCSCVECVARRGRVDKRIVVLERPTIERVLDAVDPEDTLILARTNELLRRVRGLLVRNGVPFHNMRGPEDASATWTRGLIAAKHFNDLLRGESLPYGRVVGLLDQLDVSSPASGERGYVTREKRAEFKSLPKRMGAAWPYSPLGEDLRSWTLGMLRPYLARVPRGAEVANAFGCANRRDVLDAHARLRPSWPITTTSGVRVGTIHSSKGEEARTVALLADVSKRALSRVYQNETDHDTEHRLFYVGATRAVQRLVVASPMFTDTTFPLPLGVVA